MGTTTITVNTKQFVERLLRPVSRVSDSCTLKISGGRIYAVAITTRTGADQIAVLGSCPVSGTTTSATLPIGDPVKYIQVLSLQEHSGVESITFQYDGVSLSYHKNNSVEAEKKCPISDYRFVLMDDSADSTSGPYNVIQGLTPSTTLTLNVDDLKDIRSVLSAISSNANKMYISASGSSMIGEITDKKIDGTDTVKVKLSDSFTGDSVSNVIIATSIFGIINPTLSTNDVFTVGICPVSSNGKVVLITQTFTDKGQQFITKYCVPTKVN